MAAMDSFINNHFTSHAGEADIVLVMSVHAKLSPVRAPGL